MHTQLENELETLKEKILLMGGRVEEAIRLSIKALVDRDSKLATQVIQHDRDINDLEIEVDEHCHKMLALFQPTAGDMRFITSAMKINSDLERMGDLSVNIAERVLALNEVAPLKPYIDLPRMAVIAQEMVRSALDSLVSRNVVAAKKVCERDDEVDHLNDQIFRELISFMLEDRANIKRALDLILVARHLERIADHATNVAEDVIYLVEGRDIRHHRG
jgi:phosphate transport system protein